MDSDFASYVIWAVGLLATVVILLHGDFAVTLAVVAGAIITLISLWAFNKGNKDVVNLKTDVSLMALTVPMIILSLYAIVFWDFDAFTHLALVAFLFLLIFAIAVFGE